MATAHRFREIGSASLFGGSLDASAYEHEGTRAAHYHFVGDSVENAFIVAFRTIPNDNSGVAHVLEHLVLLGSRRFQGHAPFFAMNGRSLNTYMNAFTSADHTAYAFATPNSKDFFNLLDVVLDLTFFPILRQEDFEREACRIDFHRARDGTHEAKYNGVVYNEMLSKYANVDSYLWATLCSQLHRTSTYRHDSGGAPSSIAQLTCDDVRRFHRTFYHPSNAIFLSFGDVPVKEIQARIQRDVISGFDGVAGVPATIAPEECNTAPIVVETAYPSTSPDGSHFVLAWLLDDASLVVKRLEATLIKSLLLDHSGSPLRHFLKSTDLAESISTFYGLHKNNQKMIFVCGLQSIDAGLSKRLEQEILKKIEETIEALRPDDVDAVLQKMEIELREVGGDQIPYPIQILLKALLPAVHMHNVLANTDASAGLEALKAAITVEKIRDRIRHLLLVNPHRVALTLVPSEAAAHAHERMVTPPTGMSTTADKMRSAAAPRRQRSDSLPKISVADIPPAVTYPEPIRFDDVGDGAIYTDYTLRTNGLVHIECLHRIPDLGPDEIALLSLYNYALTMVGVGGATQKDTERRRAACCGRFQSSILSRPVVGHGGRPEHFLAIHLNTLALSAPVALRLLWDTVTMPSFDDLDNLHKIIRHVANSARDRVSLDGHAFAMGVASRAISPLGRMRYETTGIQGIDMLRRLRHAGSGDELRTLAQRLQTIHAKVTASTPRILRIADPEQIAGLAAACERQFGGRGDESSTRLAYEAATAEPERKAWVIRENTNHCSRAWPAVPYEHEDAAALTVLAKYLREGFLHHRLRERSGAYGSGAMFDPDTASFRMYTYRDPRLEETFAAFDEAAEWSMAEEVTEELHERALLSAMRTLDKPMSPVGKVRVDYHCRLFGRNPVTRARRRQRTLDVTRGDVSRVATRYLRPRWYYDGLLLSQAHVGAIRDRGWEITTLT